MIIYLKLTYTAQQQHLTQDVVEFTSLSKSSDDMFLPVIASITSTITSPRCAIDSGWICALFIILASNRSATVSVLMLTYTPEKSVSGPSIFDVVASSIDASATLHFIRHIGLFVKYVLLSAGLEQPLAAVSLGGGGSYTETSDIKYSSEKWSSYMLKVILDALGMILSASNCIMSWLFCTIC